jgi:hypothetical protein
MLFEISFKENIYIGDLGTILIFWKTFNEHDLMEAI